MKITYNKNPLLTTVELDDHDREVFRLKIKVEELESRLFSTYFDLTENDPPDVKGAIRHSNPEYYMDDHEKTRLDERVDMLLEDFIAELLGTHCGDCTCVACSCSKCRAERILGIDTLAPFPGKHELHAVDKAFCADRSLSEALDYLRDHKISTEKPEGWDRHTQEDYERLVARWQEQQACAYAYLSGYAKRHFD